MTLHYGNGNAAAGESKDSLDSKEKDPHMDYIVNIFNTVLDSVSEIFSAVVLSS
ncbi:hypothetical protein [Corynebacterium callunae]|uniref:hypothetical protein n=1 Tax=Corynebacterium callunae TaxID=1721 RepID=UPI0012DF623A|nr:hypothetical protein [Corynebacterium callunae]MCK2200791.1 hypothetical protein [Corynebacterium callunae]